MRHFTQFQEFSPLYLLQLAFTIWMLVDARRRGVDFYWFWIILIFQPIGPWAYFIIYKISDFRGSTGWLTGLLHRRASLDELRHRAERLPTPANWLELGERLVETKAFSEAQPQLQAVLAREPEHCRALFLLAECHSGLDQPEEAVPLLRKILTRHPGWGDYQAWRTLVEVSKKAGDREGALGQCRELAKIAPRLQHKCLLAEHLLETGETVEARKVVEQGLDDFRYSSGLGRRLDGRWVGKAKQLLKQTS
jgi:hypothetical protein